MREVNVCIGKSNSELGIDVSFINSNPVLRLDVNLKINNTRKEVRIIGWSVPASTAESEAFVTHFLNNGREECTFKELKQYVKFHGTRKQGRIYATIQITDEYLYVKLLRKDANLQRAIGGIITFMIWLIFPNGTNPA